MRIQTILNHVEKFKSFVYGRVRIEADKESLAVVVDLRPWKKNCPLCSGCGWPDPVCDHSEERRFEFVPL